MPSPDTQFAEMVRDHARLMASAVRRVCGRRYRTLVPDVEQDVYLALWKRLQGGKKIEYPVSYLYKMALTTALAVVRKLEREVPLELAEEVSPNPGTAVPRDLHPAERARLLEQILGHLEAPEAQALRAYLAGFTQKEVAKLYGWSESTARHRIYRSIDRLKTQLRGDLKG